MNKNTTIKILTGILLAAASTGAMAQSALSQLGSQAGVDFAPLAAQAQAARKDVLASCSVLDAKPFMPWNVSQAAILIQTCLNHAYPADGAYRVQAQVARFNSHACPNGGPANCAALVDVVGIKIVVSGQLTASDAVLGDLKSSLDRRGDKLMSFETKLENKAEISN